MLFWPAITAVELVPLSVRAVVNALPKAKMPPLLTVKPVAEPMPKAVRPRLPPETVMAPVNWLAEAGFRIQVPPSALPTLSVAVALLASTMFI